MPPPPPAQEGSLAHGGRWGSSSPLVSALRPLGLPEGGHVADCSEAGPRARAGRSSVGGLSCEPAA